MRFRGVVFDLDGTLLDTLGDIARAANSVLVSHGLPAHPLDAYRWLIGDGVTMLFTRAVPADKNDTTLIADCADEFRAAYERNWNVHTQPFDGVPELLDALTTRQLKLAILSNKPHSFTCQCVDAYLDRWHFEPVFGQRDGVPRKPDPAGVYEITAHLGIPPQECVYIGDTNVDMQTARNSGMYPVGALWGYRSLEELQANGAETVIQHPAELLTVLDHGSRQVDPSRQTELDATDE